MPDSAPGQLDAAAASRLRRLNIIVRSVHAPQAVVLLAIATAAPDHGVVPGRSARRRRLRHCQPRQRADRLAGRLKGTGRSGSTGITWRNGRAPLYALRSLARRHQALNEEIAELDGRLAKLTAQAAPRQ